MNLATIGSFNTTTQAFFRHRKVAGRHLLTNLEGKWALLSDDEFQLFAQGGVQNGTPLWQRLKEGNFLKSEYNVEKAAEGIRRRKKFVGSGTNLHVFVVTLRCNTTCVYCHASRAPMSATHTDMTKEIAEKAVDIALQTTSPSVTFEFQGGEPLVNFPVVKHIIEYAREKNQDIGKIIDFTMVSNLSLMDDEKLEYLVSNKVQICTSIDGPEHLHDKQRRLPGLSAHKSTVEWIKRINVAYEKMGLDTSLYHVEALMTTTRDTLPLWKEVVDTYVELGCKALMLRPVDPFGWAEKTGYKVEYPRSEYREFYRNAVEYMLELNTQGVQILERFAAIFLTKILNGEDPNFLDIRSPGGAGIGQLAYSYDGSIFTCDEGRMLHESNDNSFLIGHVDTSTYRSLVGHETVRAVTLASNLDALPDCVNCTYNPYCGVPPVHTHKTQGQIFGHMRESSLCAVYKGIQDYIFEKLGDADPVVLETFSRWTTVRDREHFLQDTDVA